MKRIHVSAILFAPLLALCAALQLHGTTLARLSLNQLTSAATVVAFAKCTGSASVWHNGEIWTINSFHTEETWKGTLPQEFQVWMLGGHSGAVTSYIPDAPRFIPGEEVVLFLEPTRSRKLSITAWGEGTFRIRRDPLTGEARVTQDVASTPVFDPRTHRFRPSGIRDWPLQALKARVLAAVDDPGQWRKK